VGFANPTEKYTQVNLGDDWGLNMMVPPNGAYYVYDGSMVVPNCQPAKWVVFKSMINIDSNDFALLVKNVSPGSRPVQPLGDREVFFNDIQQLAGSPMPNDGKTYMRCRRLGKSKPEVKDVQPAGVKEAKDKKESEKKHPAVKWAQDQLAANGLIEIINVILMVCALGFGFWYGMSQDYRFIGKKPFMLAFDLAAQIRSILDTYILRFFTTSVDRVQSPVT
jgi:hypothetical protein